MMRPQMLAILGLAVSACSTAPMPADDTQRTTDNPYTGAKMTVDYIGGTDVSGFHFEIDAVACEAGADFEEFHYEENVALSDTLFPGMIEFLEKNPFDEESSHVGADFFLAVEPGCYTITASPAAWIDGDDWGASEDCSVAETPYPVEVVAGYTTEPDPLISQCVGEENGAIDQLVLMNVPPTLEPDIDEKYNYECEAVEICAVGWDPNNDPIEFDWNDDKCAIPVWDMDIGEAEMIGFENGVAIWEQCAEITTQYTDTYDIEVEVYDMAYNDYGELVRIEDLIGEESHASLTVPIHTNWVQEPLCIDDDGHLQEPAGYDLEREKYCEYTSAEEFYCSGYYDVDPKIAEYVCDGHDLIEEALYPECPA